MRLTRFIALAAIAAVLVLLPSAVGGVSTMAATVSPSAVLIRP